MSIWAPVVAALGASGITGVFGFGTIWWQQRHADRGASLSTKRSAYQQLIGHSLSFSIRATTLRNAMQARSGIAEGVDVAMRLRRPIDPLELHDWLAEGFAPINEAWSAVQTIGSPDAVSAAASLVDACADLLGVAIEPGEARGKIGSAVKGLAWTAEQEEALQQATSRMVKEREAFIRVARSEMGAEAVAPVLESVAQRVIARNPDRAEKRAVVPTVALPLTDDARAVVRSNRRRFLERV